MQYHGSEITASSVEVEPILELRDNNHDQFTEVVEQVEFDFGGMWYSELFLFILLCEQFDCSRVIESGRARGISTELLSRYFVEEDIEIVSVEKDADSEAAEIAETRLDPYDNVTLKYGNSLEIVPELVKDGDAVLIDGPKGTPSLELAADVLESASVSFVGVHDLHRDAFTRDLSEVVFKNRLYTDHKELVEAFRDYDQPIHEWNRKYRAPEDGMYGPYSKFGYESDSYGPTLGVFFNDESPVVHRVLSNYHDHMGRTTTALVGEILKRQQEVGGPIRKRVARLGLTVGQHLLR